MFKIYSIPRSIHVSTISFNCICHNFSKLFLILIYNFVLHFDSRHDFLVRKISSAFFRIMYLKLFIKTCDLQLLSHVLRYPPSWIKYATEMIYKSAFTQFLLIILLLILILLFYDIGKIYFNLIRYISSLGINLKE